jgi:hypothetical protein
MESCHFPSARYFGKPNPWRSQYRQTKKREVRVAPRLAGIQPSQCAFPNRRLLHSTNGRRRMRTGRAARPSANWSSAAWRRKSRNSDDVRSDKTQSLGGPPSARRAYPCKTGRSKPPKNCSDGVQYFCFCGCWRFRVATANKAATARAPPRSQFGAMGRAGPSLTGSESEPVRRDASGGAKWEPPEREWSTGPKSEPVRRDVSGGAKSEPPER